MADRLLVVTADDVGLHEAMTRGAIEAHRQGIVTACSVVATGRAFDDAITALHELRSLEVGIHLTLVEGTPLTPPARIESLVTSGGRFHPSYRSFVARYAARSIRLTDIGREFRAQIERLLGTGLRVMHANGHQHLHTLPQVFDLVQRLADEYRIKYVRTIDDRGGGMFARFGALNVLNSLGRRARRNARLATNDHTIGIANAGHLSVRRLIALLPHVEDVTELVCHPAVASDSLARMHPWKYDWAAELESLCSDEVRKAIAARGIRLVRPSDVAFRRSS